MTRLSGMDASFLYMETPSMHTHVCLAAVLDPSTMPVPYSFEVIRDRVEERVPLIAPFRRVLREVPMRIHHPVWADDPANPAIKGIGTWTNHTEELDKGVHSLIDEQANPKEPPVCAT